jgi:hypothetical protein
MYIIQQNDVYCGSAQEVGLPSRTADFRLQTHIDEDKQRRPWWKIRTQRASENEASKPLNHKTSFDIVQTNGDIRRPLCHVELLNDTVMGTKGPGWSGPSIHMSLPSFSGKTKQQPELLKYSCSLNCRYGFLSVLIFKSRDLCN